MASSISNGTTTHEFIFQNAVPKNVVQDTFIADKPDKTTEVINTEIVQKAISLTAFLISESGLSARKKLYRLLDFHIENLNTELTLTIEYEDETKTHQGKIIGEINGVLAERLPKAIQFTFTFILIDANWGSS